MESLDLSTAILFLIVGTIIGVALSKILAKGPSNNQLQQQLEDTQDQFTNYQKEVGTHFEQTASLVNKMTDSYREVHEHLSKGAQSLAQESNIALTLQPTLKLEPLNSAENTDTDTDKSDDDSELNNEALATDEIKDNSQSTEAHAKETQTSS